MRSRRGKWLAGLALALLGLASIGSAFDRMAHDEPRIARLVPEPFRAGADLAQGRLALIRGQESAARDMAGQAVDASPVDPATLALLGQARLANGELVAAQNAFRSAAAFGWREPATQAYWLQAALQAGDWQGAGLRADALLRSQSELRGDFALLAVFEGTGAGQAVLSGLVAGRPPWLHAYLQPASVPDDAALVRRAAFLGQPGLPGVTCQFVLPMVEQLLARGAAGQGRALWQSRCGGVADGGLQDGKFAQLAAGSANPFGWRRVASGDVSLSGGGRGLVARNRAPAPRLIIWQSLALPEGRYRAILPEAEASQWRVALSCGGAPDRRPPPWASEFIIEDCEAQTLSLWLEPGSGEERLSQIALERID